MGGAGNSSDASARVAALLDVMQTKA